MKKKGILFLLVFTIFLTACNQNIELSQTTTEASTNYENDKINIKIANDMDKKEEIYENILEDLEKVNDFSPIENLEIEISKRYIVPNLDKVIKADDKFIETEEFKKELIKKSYGIYDNWIVEGLYTKIFDIDGEITDYSTYYKNHDFSLFGARFYQPFSSEEEIKNVKSASTNLVEYLLKNNKKTELLKNNIEISDIENWAKDKNIDLSYQKEIKSLMNRMEVLDKKNQLIIDTVEETNGFTIEIDYSDKLNEQYDTTEKIEHIILRFDRDILAIKKGIEKDAPNFYEDYREVLNNVPKIEYIFDENSDGYADGGYFLRDRGRIHLRDMLAHSHEYGHFLFHDPFVKAGISITKPVWLDEGITEYLTIVYAEDYVKLMNKVFDMYFTFKPDNSDVQNVLDDVLKILIENNIDINNMDEFAKAKNKRIMASHIHYIQTVKSQEIMGFITEENETNTNSDLIYEGNTLNYHLNFSFVSYLIEEYGLEKILYLNVADFSELTYEEVFGKSFEELQIDWIDYLKDNIKDIELIL